MKPIYLRLHQDGVEIAINMNAVAYLAPNEAAKPEEKCVVYFPCWIPVEGFGEEPLHLIVDESLDKIGKMREWF